MNNNILKFSLAVSLVLNLTVVATAGYRYYAQSRAWVSPFGTTMEKDRFLFEELSLKPEQMEAMKNEARAFRREIDRRRREISEKRKELLTLMRRPDPDRKTLNGTIKEISGKQEEMQRMIVGHMLKIRSKLDAERQRKFIDLIERNMVGGGLMGCPPSHGAVSEN